jgi:RNA polymerase sigma-70 factor (ECF subfamily)
LLRRDFANYQPINGLTPSLFFSTHFFEPCIYNDLARANLTKFSKIFLWAYILLIFGIQWREPYWKRGGAAMVEILTLYVGMLETPEEKAAFTEVYREFYLACFHTALSITNNQQMAEDAVHNAFVSIIKNKEKYLRPSCKISRSQIVIITKNKVIDLLRGRNECDKSETDNMEQIPEDFDLAETAASEEGYRHLLDCVARLPEKYKAVFELKYVHEKSSKEIAALLGMKVSTVDVQMLRAKRMLQAMIKEGGQSG